MPTRSVIGAHAQGFVEYDRLLLPILKAFAKYTQYMLPEVLCSRTVCHCYLQQPLVSCRDHHVVCMYYCSWLPIFWRVLLCYFGGGEDGGGKVLHKVHTFL